MGFKLIMRKNKHLLPLLGESILKKAETIYKENGYFTDAILEELHSIYSTTLNQALDIIDRTKVIQYYATDSKRSLYVIVKGDKQLRLFEDINFCFCKTFRKDVLESANIIMCKHVLALKLKKITEEFFKEEMSDLYFVESLKIMSEIL